MNYNKFRKNTQLKLSTKTYYLPLYSRVVMCILSLLHRSPLFIICFKKALIDPHQDWRQHGKTPIKILTSLNVFTSLVLQGRRFWEPHEQTMLHICAVYEGHFHGCSGLLCPPCRSSGSNLLHGEEGDALPHSRLPTQAPGWERRSCQSARSPLRHEIMHVFLLGSVSRNINCSTEWVSKLGVRLGICHARC